MRWIAPAITLLLAGLFTPAAWAQISATPAPRFTPSGTLTTPAGTLASTSGPLATAAALRSPEADQIRAWYRDYLGRDVGADLASWADLLRGGMSATDVQASILGSDEFAYQKGRDPQSFVRETLQAITWSEPTPNEVQRWTDRLAQLRGDHFTLAREILLANSQASGAGAQVNQVSDIATRLASAARLAVDTIDFEIGGTPQGRQANLQAQSLLTATNQFQRTVSVASYRPDDALLSLNSSDRAYQALQSTLSNPTGTAPSAAGIVRRIGTMLADARNAIRPTSSPSYPSLPSSGYNTQQLLDQVTAARRATDSLIQTLTSQAYQNYSYSVVLRDLDTLASRLTGLDQLIRSGSPADRLSWEVQSLADIADRVRTQLNAGRPPYSVRLYWQSIDSSLAQMRETLGAVAGGSTVLRPSALYTNLVPLLDQAASQLDIFLAGINPLVFGIPDVPSVQNDARSLKSRVMTMRQQAVAGEPASVLKRTLSMMVGDYQDAYDRWNRIVATYRLINPAKLSPVGESLNRVEQMINDALASGDLTPTGPTRVTQNLSQLSAEVADARRTLTVFTGYREQQSLDLYFEQLAGYVQSISDSLSRATTVDARRLAVAMQGVIGRLQAEIENLNQRTAAGGTRDQQAYANDLRTRAYRIGKLVDDIEAALY